MEKLACGPLLKSGLNMCMWGLIQSVGLKSCYWAKVPDLRVGLWNGPKATHGLGSVLWTGMGLNSNPGWVSSNGSATSHSHDGAWVLYGAR